MSKENRAQEMKVVPEKVQPTEVFEQPASPASPAPPPNPRLQDVDKLQLDLVKSNRKTALANAQKALAENEVAELNYKYLVLQIYMRYGLTEADAISEDGQIIKGGAVQTNKAQVR